MTKSLQLEAPATRADVIGWALTVPIVLWLLLSLGPMANLPGSLAIILEPYGQPATLEARVVLALGAGGVVALYALLMATPIVVLFRSRRAWPKVLIPLVSAASGLALQLLLVHASFESVATLAASMR